MKSVNLSELAKLAAGESLGLRPIIEKEIIQGLFFLETEICSGARSL